MLFIMVLWGLGFNYFLNYTAENKYNKKYNIG